VEVWYLIIFCDIVRCEHEPFLPAAECVASLVGSHNEEHYFVATQDLDLRKRLRKVCTQADPLFFPFRSTCTVGTRPCGVENTHVHLSLMLLEG